MSLQESLQQLWASLSRLLISVLNPIVLIPIIIITVVLVKKNKEYKNSAYYQITKLPYRSVKRDTGRYGEYLTYKYLKHFETNGAKFLFNIYIPKENGETAEIDVLMICSKGIFVFESKNYSGWIFGSEDQKNWYQTLPAGRGRSHKEHFYNPIMQNRSHIKHLKALLGEQVPMWSIIVFSDRCTLQSVKIQSDHIHVINRNHVAHVVSGICDQMPSDLLGGRDITSFYDKLYPYTQVDANTKEQHIASIHNNLNRQPVQPTDSPFVLDTQAKTIEPPAAEQSQTEDALPNSADTIESKAETNEVQIIGATEARPAEPETKKPKILKCPKCNGNLVLRTATRGTNAGNQFYGCSNYPKCKYIQNYVTQAK